MGDLQVLLILALIIAALMGAHWIGLPRQRRATPLHRLMHSDAAQILDEAEMHTLKFLIVLYSNQILEADLNRTDGTVWLSLIFDTRYVLVPSMQVSLTSLAKMQQEKGLTDATIKQYLKLGTPQELTGRNTNGAKE